MEKGSLAAMELMVFLGLAAWLVYYQFSTSRRDPGRKESDADAAAGTDEASDREPRTPPGA